MASAKGCFAVTVLIALLLPPASPALLPKKNSKSPAVDSQQLRSDYIGRLQQQTVPQQDTRTLGSLWSPNNYFADLSSDYKARTLNDPITIRVAVTTSATANGNVTSQRDFNTQAGITGLPGDLKTKGVNPLFNANSSTQLKGTGATANNSNLVTNLTGQVIAVLANGNLVVEAQRQIYMNKENQTMIVRGVVRPNDIATDNSVVSAQLGNLEIELKGKGIISDSTRPPNPVTRFLLKIFGL